VGDANHKEAENILRDADIAMYRAKISGKGQYAIFDPSMHKRAVNLLALENDIRRAVERREFELYYQPIIRLKTGRISGFEALIRWHHPQRGLVSPAEFIPIAEETGLINDIGDWVLKDACQLIQTWEKQLDKNSMPTININVSSKQIAHGDLVEKITSTIEKNQISGANLKLEFTESMVMENPEMASSMITELKQYHVQTAIDDFGTGYSSLSYLHQFPIDTLKIDRSFINELKADGTNAEIVNTIVMLAHNLSLDVVAEGIEEEYQLQHLHSIGCDFAQGYYFAKPMPASEALAALLTNNTNNTNNTNIEKAIEFNPVSPQI
jgi:EAL domain-containing protein (putative c-di-GMP-specific phosphodiesterase class I)